MVTPFLEAPYDAIYLGFVKYIIAPFSCLEPMINLVEELAEYLDPKSLAEFGPDSLWVDVGAIATVAVGKDKNMKKACLVINILPQALVCGSDEAAIKAAKYVASLVQQARDDRMEQHYRMTDGVMQGFMDRLEKLEAG